MNATSFTITYHASLVMFCVILACGVQAQDATKTMFSSTNADRTNAAEDNCGASPPLSPAAEGESGTFETGANSRNRMAIESAVISAVQTPSTEQTDQTCLFGTSKFGSVAQQHLGDELEQRDPAFNQYVDFTLLERAMSDLNASLLADVALELAEGERVLMRPHKCGLTSDKLVAKAAALALRMNDPETIKRLQQAADALKKPAWTKALADANEFGGKSRDPGPSVSLSALEPNVVELANAVRRATDAAVLTSNKDDLESIKATVNESVKDEKIKTYLIQSIDTSLKALPEKLDPGDEFLAEFAAGSRDWGIGGIRVPSLPSLPNEVVDPVRRVIRETPNPINSPQMHMDPRYSLPSYRFYITNATNVRLGINVEYKNFDNAWTRTWTYVDPGQKRFLFPTYNRYVYVSAGSLDLYRKLKEYPRRQVDLGPVFNDHTLNFR